MNKISAAITTDISASHLNVLRSISHELKTPLLHIKGTSELLLKGVDDKAIEREHLCRLEMSAERMLRMIDAYVYTQQVATGQLFVNADPVNIGSIAHGVVIDLQQLALRYDTQLSLNVTKMLHPASVDRVALRHMLYGILDVAIRTSKSEVIEVTIQHKADTIVVSIHDDGEALPTGAINTSVRQTGASLRPSKYSGATASTSVYIADILSKAMFGSFAMQHRKGKRHIAVAMPRSSQMKLPL